MRKQEADVRSKPTDAAWGNKTTEFRVTLRVKLRLRELRNHRTCSFPAAHIFNYCVWGLEIVSQIHLINSGTTVTMARRSVQGLRTQGQTPKKIFTYNKEDPSSYVPSATPTRMEDYQNKEQLRSSLSFDLRPKTSRGTSRPSPDAFADYVVPSPLRDSMMENMQNHENNSNKRNISNKIAVVDVHSTDETTHVLSEKDVYIGCWLFGALLRV